MPELADYPYSAEVFEGLAWRMAMKDYLVENLRWKRPKGKRAGVEVYEFPVDVSGEATYPLIVIDEGTGRWDSSSLTPVILKSTQWPSINPQFCLVKDASWVETVDLILKGTDVIQLAAIMLALRPLLCPHASKYGSLMLPLGNLYFSQEARITPNLAQITWFTEPGDPMRRIRAVKVQLDVEVPSCKVVSVASMKVLKYNVDMRGPESDGASGGSSA